MTILKNWLFSSNKVMVTGTVIALLVCILAGLNIIAGAKMAPTGLSTGGAGADAGEGKQAVVSVATAPASIRQIRHKISLTGSIAARDELPVGAQASGLQIKQVLVEEGDSVKKGQVLAELDNAVLKAQIAQEEAQLASAQATHQKALQPNTSEEIAQQKAAVLSAQAAVQRSVSDVKKANSEYKNSAVIAKRYSTLHKEGGSSDEETEQKITNAETALASLDSSKQAQDEANQTLKQAQEKLHQYLRGGREEDIRIAKATVDQHVAKIAELRANLEQTFVRAPEDGLVTERDAHLGDISASTKTLFKIDRSNQLEMTGNLSQTELALIHIGQEAEVTDGAKSVTGKIWLISPTVDSNSRLGKVHITVPYGKGFLQGMFVTASMQSDKKQALTIPEAAVQSDSDHSFAFVVTDGICHKVWVKTGDRSDGQVEIVSGLNTGDQVVTDGVSLITDKDKVRVAQSLDEVVK